MEWQTRVKSINELSTIVDQTSEMYSDPDEKRLALLHIFKQVQVPLSLQLMDTRSVLTKQTITALIHFAENYPQEFGAFSGRYFKENDGLFKLLKNGKSLISDMAHEGIQGIIGAVCIPK